MQTQNVIRTLFEYTSKGYEEANKNATELLGKIAALRTQEKELNKTLTESDSILDKLIKRWAELDATMNSDTPKKVREEYAQLNKVVAETTAVRAKAALQLQANAKAQEADNKKAKEAADIASSYKKVLDELSKGLGNAEVSTEALAKAKKYLNSEMSKTNVGTEKYKELSKELAQVTKASSDVTAAQRQQVKEMGVAEDSIEALRLKVAATKKEWLSMSQTDPGFKAKEKELKKYTDELVVAEEKVGIFSRSVGNYKSALDGLGGSLNSIVPGLGGVTKGIGAMTKQALAFIATPIGAIIAAITIALKALHSAFTRSAEGQEKFNVLMGYLSGVINVLLDLLADLGEWLIKIFTEPKAAFEDFKKYVLDPATLGIRTIANAAMGAGLAVAGIFSKKAREESKEYFSQIKQDWQDVADTAVGVYDAIKGKAKEVADDAKAMAEIAKRENELKREQIEMQGRLGELNRQINEAREKSMQVDQYSNAERLAFMEESKRLTEEVGRIEVDWAQRSYEIIRDKNALSKSTLEDLQKEADAQRAVDDRRAKTIMDSRRMVSQISSLRKSTSDKAKADQDKANADYMKAMQDRMKAAEDLAKAEADGNTKGLELYKNILAEHEAELAKASAKRLTLSQLEKDELELQEYAHQKNLEAIKKDADEKKATDYLKALTDSRNAQVALLEAQKRGNADEIALYQRLLDQKAAALAKYSADEVQLNQEQRLAEEMAAFDHQQKVINDYIALQQQLADLQNQYQEAQTQAEQEAIQKQINLVAAKVAAQVKTLQALGVNIDGINVEIEQSIDTTQQYLSERLQQSLQTIEQFSGRSKNNFFKLASSITGLVAKAFDFKKVTEGMDITTKEFKKMKGEFTAGMAEIGAAVAVNGLNAAVDIINQNIEAEKQAIDEMYAYQEKRAQESYDQQSRNLKAALDDKEISEAKYRLEQMKLDDKKAEGDKKREKDKANAQYDLELKQFRVNQAKDAISATIATSLGIINAVAQMPLTGGMPFAAIVAAMGAAQVATIYAQKPPQKPKFEKGGGIRFEPIDGPSHNSGGVPIRFGNRVVAEAEGDEGALIISKKAMRNNYMRQLLAFVESVGAGISGTQSDPSKFAEGGYLSYDEDFFMPARNSLKITKRKKRSIRINGKKVKLKPYGWNADAAIDDYAEKIAIPQWNAYIDRERAKLANREAEINEAINAGISNNETLKSMGVTDITSFNQLQADKEKELDTVQKQIKVYEEAANARIDALKAELQYEQKLADFEKQRKDAASELATATEEFNTRVLGELRETGQITEEEYLSMLDQIKHGYGVKTTDIINLKKKEVEAIKKLINEERDAELNAAKETAKYREDALAQMRSEWEENYNAITQQIIDDAESASDAISQLTGTDLERFNQILHIQQEIKKMEEDYAKNETLLTDGVITSREERAALVAEQKRIKEELARKEQEAEEAKAAFEAERQKNMEAAMKAYETENFADLLAQIKELGADLQAEGNKWTLDKELAAELDAELQAINATYDEQIAKQDAIIDGLQAEIDAAQLLHDKKVAYIKEEEEALKATFEEQKAAIDTWLANATSGLRTEAAELSQFVAALKVAGIEAGLTEYEKAMEALNKNIDALQSTGGKKYETGGAVEIGSGLYQVAGPSHSQGGVPIRVGNTQIAEVEGIEKMFAVNKMAANDPEMMAALAKASNINARYTGVPLVDPGSGEGFALDYDLLAAKIGAQINSRPTKTYVTHRDVKTAYDITQMHKKSSFMG